MRRRAVSVVPPRPGALFSEYGEQLSLAKTVAVKVIHPHLLGDQASVARFYTEVRGRAV